MTALSPRYCLLISGGVDSAVACHLLCCHGIRPDLYYIEIGPQGEGLTCTAEVDIKLSRLTSSILIYLPFHGHTGRIYHQVLTRGARLPSLGTRVQ